MASSGKKKPALVYKPIYRGKPFCGLVAKRGLKLLVYQLIFSVFYLLMGAALSAASLVIRYIVAAALLLVCIAIVWGEAAKHGESDVSIGQIVYARKQDGKPVSDDNIEKCFHPLRSVTTLLTGVLPLVILALVFSLIAKREIPSMPVPGWISDSIQTGKDPSLYYYSSEYYSMRNPTGIAEVLRVIVRTFIFPFVSLADSMDKDARLLVDRLSPILIMIPYLSYIPGYLLSTRERAQVHGSIAASDRKEKKRRMRMEKRRAERENKNQLI